MGDQLKQLVLIVSAGGEVSVAAEIGRARIAPQSINVVQQLLAEGLGNLRNETVEVHLTRQHTVQLFVDLNHLELGVDGRFGHAAQTLTANRLSAVRSVSHVEQQVAIFDLEQILVAQRDIAEVHQRVEIFILYR